MPATTITTARPHVGTLFQDRDPHMARAEREIRDNFRHVHGRSADTNSEIDLLRLVALAVAHHRAFSVNRAFGDDHPVTKGFIAVAHGWQAGM